MFGITRATFLLTVQGTLADTNTHPLTSIQLPPTLEVINPKRQTIPDKSRHIRLAVIGLSWYSY